MHGLLWVALGAALWGTDTVLRRPLTGTLQPEQIVFCEHVVMSAVLLPVLWRTRREWRGLGRKQWAAVAAIAWGGSALATVAFTYAVRSGNPTTAVLLQKSQPLFAAGLARVLLGEVLTPRFWCCLALALSAAWLVSFGWAAPSVSGAAGALPALAAAALWGSATVLGRFVLRSISFGAVTALRAALATPLLAVWAGPLPALRGSEAARLAVMALIPGLLALLLYYRGLARVRASHAAIAELSFPVTAGLLNWYLLGMGAAPAQIAGFALLWIAILVLEHAPPAAAVLYQPQKED